MPKDIPFLSHDNDSTRDVVNDHITGENVSNRGLTDSRDSILPNDLD